MKKGILLVICCVCGVGLLAACSSKNRREKPAKKIYLTKEDYQEDAAHAAEIERREAQPNYESDYIFNAYPQADPNVYFFDKRQQPKVPGEYSAKDYKNEKRLWKKPKRYSPDQYYGMQEGTSENTTTAESGYYEESSEGY